MRAYVFWHYPFAEVNTQDYERALLNFQSHLTGTPPEGMRGCTSYRTSKIPWLNDREGYEDWYFVDSSAVLDSLNEAAVKPERSEVHTAAASKMEFGRGGLYYLLFGNGQSLDGSTVTWLKRPRGIRYEEPLKEMAKESRGFLSCWRVQMVLGPADEFAVVGTSDLHLAVPEHWQARTIKRTILAKPPDVLRRSA